MARRKIPSDSNAPFHVTGRVHNRDPFPLPLAEVWDIFQNRLYYINRLYGIQVLNFVLMPNHFHAIFVDQSAMRSKAMADLQRETAKEINSRAARMNQLWGRPYFSSVINSPHYYMNCYKYVYQNPVRAALCDAVEAYPFSTLHGLLGQSRLLIPLAEDTTLLSDVEGALRWLNTMPAEEDLAAMRRGLSRRFFYLPTDRQTRRPHRLETALI